MIGVLSKSFKPVITVVKPWVDKYSLLLKIHPYSTKMISAAILGGSADIFVQNLIEEQKKFDIRRWFSSMGVAIMYIPFFHKFYGIYSPKLSKWMCTKCGFKHRKITLSMMQVI